eukprot:TRINITY_DN16256_c3_g1_i1.p1 TRINITY_DN16256_c3_g1~~TRINITY_DN16256_c3_g1_i1.p1  ORF type:complete len:348 (-),score=82.17 TRINITY_DN16256_c3_g1_i1:153-1196(-)
MSVPATFTGGKGKGKWGKGRRFDDDGPDERPQQYTHAMDNVFKTEESYGTLKAVQMDALVFLQIMKHCRQQAPQPVTGQLLGMDVGDDLQLTHSFGYVQKSASDEQSKEDDGEQYQMDTLRRLREVNIDSNTVGWYQTTYLGQFISTTVIETQHLYQTEIPRSVLVVYDSLQAAIGKPAFKALQLTQEFMDMYRSVSSVATGDFVDVPQNEMFREIPVVITASPLAECFLLDWSIMDPLGTTTQLDALDVENQAFFEKNVQLLSASLSDLAEEQNKMIMFERNANRGKGDDKGKGKGFRFNAQPRPLDTMVLSKQIQNYCKAINTYAGDAFSKVYLVSNKPTTAGAA